jgi:hypothetical protein
MSIIGSAVRAIQSGREQKRKGKQIREAGTLQDRQDALKKYRPEFEIDRGGIDNYKQSLVESKKFANKQLDRANYNKITSGGRAVGDELARDENRRASSNAMSSAARSTGSASDMLSMISMVQAQEQQGNRSIDASSQAQMVGNQRFAEAGVGSAQSAVAQSKRDYSSGLFNANTFNTDADISEFQANELDPYMQALSDERQLRGAYENARFQKQEGWAQFADDVYATAQGGASQALQFMTGTMVPTGGSGKTIGKGSQASKAAIPVNRWGDMRFDDQRQVNPYNEAMYS